VSLRGLQGRTNLEREVASSLALRDDTRARHARGGLGWTFAIRCAQLAILDQGERNGSQDSALRRCGDLARGVRGGRPPLRPGTRPLRLLVSRRQPSERSEWASQPPGHLQRDPWHLAVATARKRRATGMTAVGGACTARWSGIELATLPLLHVDLGFGQPRHFPCLPPATVPIDPRAAECDQTQRQVAAIEPFRIPPYRRRSAGSDRRRSVHAACRADGPAPRQ
jgi:hypothetical protein